MSNITFLSNDELIEIFGQDLGNRAKFKYLLSKWMLDNVRFHLLKYELLSHFIYKFYLILDLSFMQKLEGPLSVVDNLNPHPNIIHNSDINFENYTDNNLVGHTYA